jgi:hypothetical protein
MAVSMVDVGSPTFPDYGDYRWIKPKVELLNPRNAENLVKVINHQYEICPDMKIDLSNVKMVTNVAARMICKAIYGRDTIEIEVPNEAVYSSLEWAADYLYRKGELDTIPWQISEMVY